MDAWTCRILTHSPQRNAASYLGKIEQILKTERHDKKGWSDIKFIIWMTEVIDIQTSQIERKFEPKF